MLLIIVIMMAQTVDSFGRFGALDKQGWPKYQVGLTECLHWREQCLKQQMCASMLHQTYENCQGKIKD
jgi:hypothetical protein